MAAGRVRERVKDVGFRESEVKYYVGTWVGWDYKEEKNEYLLSFLCFGKQSYGCLRNRV